MAISSWFGKPQTDPLLDQYRLALADCRELYLSSGRECARQHPELLKGPPQQFVQLMDDLHKGLLVKIYVAVAIADRSWSRPEQDFGRVLFQHVWGKELTGPELRAAWEHMGKQAATLKWYSLVRPFDKIGPLRTRIGDLETVVMRVANLVAKADGTVTAAEQARCAEITGHLLELQGLLLTQRDHDVPDGPGGHEAVRQGTAQAVRELDSDIPAVRSQCELAAPEDAPEPAKTRAELIDEALAELDALIGLGAIKQEVRSLVNFLEIQDQRQRAGLPKTSLSLHMVFRGNPGTGKTTVARIIGRIFGAMGILSKGHLVETDRSGLVAEYAGQTAAKTNKKVDEALDGILFIDEAYSLVAEGHEDPFGAEAVQTLLKRMEDDRERLVVVLAGYPKPIERLLKSNPGLSSRFGRTVTFDDYSTVELGRIFELMCCRNRYELTPGVRGRLLLAFRWLLAHRDEHFGNGRMVRNTFETAIRRLANRIVHVAPLTTQILTTFEPADVYVGGLPDAVWKHLDDADRKFKVTCPGCWTESDMPQEYLGRHVQCNKCKHQFVAGWGEPVDA